MPGMHGRRSSIVGVPTALGGHLAGMEMTPRGLRAAGLVAALRARPGTRGPRTCSTPATWPSNPASGPIPTRGRRTGRRSPSSCRARATSSRPPCTCRPSLVRPARLLDPGRRLHGPRRRARRAPTAGPEGRLALAWFDAHGDFNTPDTTPSGNVWGMPFAMICGRGDADLVAAADGPTVAEEDASAARRPGPRRDRVADAGRVAGDPFRAPACSATDGGQAALRGLGRGRRDPGGRHLHRGRHGLPRRVRWLGRDDARTGRPVARDGRRVDPGPGRRHAGRRLRGDRGSTSRTGTSPGPSRRSRSLARGRARRAPGSSPRPRRATSRGRGPPPPRRPRRPAASSGSRRRPRRSPTIRRRPRSGSRRGRRTRQRRARSRPGRSRRGRRRTRPRGG